MQLDRAQTLLAESDRWWQTFRDLPKTAELQSLTEDLDSKRTAVLHDGIGQLIGAIRHGDTGWMNESRARQLIGLYTAMNASQGALEQYLSDQAQATSAHSAALFQRLLIACMVSIVLGLSVAFYSWLTLRDALRQFESIAAGDLTERAA